jgi:hypothetical protein
MDKLKEFRKYNIFSNYKINKFLNKKLNIIGKNKPLYGFVF